MIPDKIFLQVCGSCDLDETCENCEFAKLLEGGEVTWSEDRIYGTDKEYIRKDALLEWAKKKNKRIDTEDGDYSLGYVSAMIDLIDKIESL